MELCPVVDPASGQHLQGWRAGHGGHAVHRAGRPPPAGGGADLEEREVSAREAVGGGGAARGHGEGGRADLGAPPVRSPLRPWPRGAARRRGRPRAGTAPLRRTAAHAGRGAARRRRSPLAWTPPEPGGPPSCARTPGSQGHGERSRACALPPPARERAGGRGRACAVARGSRSTRQGLVAPQQVHAALGTAPVPPRGGVAGRRARSRLPRSAVLRYGLWS